MATFPLRVGAPLPDFPPSLEQGRRSPRGDRYRNPCTSPGRIAPVPGQKSPESAAESLDWTCLHVWSPVKRDLVGGRQQLGLWFACGYLSIQDATSARQRVSEAIEQLREAGPPGSRAADRLPRQESERRKRAQGLSRCHRRM